MLISIITSPEQIAPSLPFAQGLEFRLDLLQEVPKSPLPVIFTFRKKEQGGSLAISEEKRLLRLEKFLELQPDYCDLEADTDPHWIQRLHRKFPATKFIGSVHNFTETPQDLDALFQSMQRPEFSFYKIALTARSTLDMLRLFAFAKDKKNLAWISMGKDGRPSRMLAPLTEAPFYYATLEEGLPPFFQVKLQTLVELYRTPLLNPQTKLFALIGDPVDASIGIYYHNQLFAAKKENALYINLRTSPEEIPALFRLCKQLPFFGMSVTMPHKTAVIPFLDKLDPDAEKIGAVNTICFLQGKAIGYNTDGLGAANALERHFSLQEKRVAIFGAGGAAKAIAFELLRRGAQVTIFNRTLIDNACKHFDEFSNQTFDLLINAIPHSIDLPALPPFVMDIAVTSEETALLKKAKEQGCYAIDAKAMFYEQANQQQKLWSF